MLCRGKKDRDEAARLAARFALYAEDAPLPEKNEPVKKPSSGLPAWVVAAMQLSEKRPRYAGAALQIS